MPCIAVPAPPGSIWCAGWHPCKVGGPTAADAEPLLPPRNGQELVAQVGAADHRFLTRLRKSWRCCRWRGCPGRVHRSDRCGGNNAGASPRTEGCAEPLLRAGYLGAGGDGTGCCRSGDRYGTDRQIGQRPRDVGFHNQFARICIVARCSVEMTWRRAHPDAMRST